MRKKCRPGFIWFYSCCNSSLESNPLFFIFYIIVYLFPSMCVSCVCVIVCVCGLPTQWFDNEPLRFHIRPHATRLSQSHRAERTASQVLCARPKRKINKEKKKKNKLKINRLWSESLTDACEPSGGMSFIHTTPIYIRWCDVCSSIQR